ncbi:16873_t:CDS:2 [Funneliformis mosseae]|uniref:Holocytochrome c-type synthase n=1 Tax=Funneliformis mosseae TaxID=27381 RepID=A0A9N9G2K9_FUNMO|nr:16873_t:CDS:2 [Funneliformis mosseae]
MSDTSTNSTSALQCPVDHQKWQAATSLPSIINNERKGCSSDTLINTSNNMPLKPNQKPVEGQRIPLDTSREHSSIPCVIPESTTSNRIGENNSEKVWIYPSEQMFYNAMKRKNWDPREEDMRVVVPMHNAVNEKAWKEILDWEKLHENKCGGPKLVKFQGKAKSITPKARIFNLLGHDWVVDRCGKQVTYVIDFYSGQPDPKLPQTVSFYLDVRPAFTFGGAIERLRRWTYDLKMNWMN